MHMLECMKRKGGSGIKTIVYYPQTLEKQALLDAQAAKFHAQCVAQYIERLNCPIEQKQRLLDTIARGILNSRETSEDA